MSGDEKVTITLTRAQWKLVADSNPATQETYTPSGMALFNAWQPILQAAAGEQPQQV